VVGGVHSDSYQARMSVLNLADFRKKPAPKKNDLSAPRYFCCTCDSDAFKVMASGDIHCANCSARIRTIVAKVV
jgi:DNA-directed RNA polymerase subunit RPC12/RpoP